jgi:hypothetical protein
LGFGVWGLGFEICESARPRASARLSGRGAGASDVIAGLEDAGQRGQIGRQFARRRTRERSGERPLILEVVRFGGPTRLFGPLPVGFSTAKPRSLRCTPRRMAMSFT